MRLVLLSLLLLLSGCTAMLLGGNGGAGPGERPGSRMAADGATSAAVRDRLIADSVLGRYDLSVQTVDGRVTLRGSVGTYAARSRAGALAREVSGVTSVNNRIQVRAGN